MSSHSGPVGSTFEPEAVLRRIATASECSIQVVGVAAPPALQPAVQLALYLEGGPRLLLATVHLTPEQARQLQEHIGFALWVTTG